jgi:hypothetical protein
MGFLALTPAFAEQDGGRGVAVGDGFDVHGSYYQHLNSIVKSILSIYMGTLCKRHFKISDAISMDC